MTPAQRKWIQVLHAAKRECGLDGEACRALLSGACGAESARDIKTRDQYDSAITAFRNPGFRVKSKTSRAGGRDQGNRYGDPPQPAMDHRAAGVLHPGPAGFGGPEKRRRLAPGHD